MLAVARNGKLVAEVNVSEVARLMADQQTASQQIAALTAQVGQIRTDLVNGLATLNAKLDATDDVVDGLRTEVSQGQVSQQAIDALAQALGDVRKVAGDLTGRVAAVDPQDPAGDDARP